MKLLFSQGRLRTLRTRSLFFGVEISINRVITPFCPCSIGFGSPADCELLQVQLRKCRMANRCNNKFQARTYLCFLVDWHIGSQGETSRRHLAGIDYSPHVILFSRPRPGIERAPMQQRPALQQHIFLSCGVIQAVIDHLAQRSVEVVALRQHLPLVTRSTFPA